MSMPSHLAEGMIALSKGDGMPLVAVDLACIALACSNAWAAMESAAAKPAKHLPHHYRATTYVMLAQLL